MTWNAHIEVEGIVAEYNNPCTKCKHNSFCNVSAIVHTIAPVISSVDTGSDGHMASGTAVLKCNGFEAPETESSEAEGTGEDSVA